MESAEVKRCCANAYGSEAARFLLGESFHPGGLELTRELAALLQLTWKSRVLDVACGKGSSAFALAEMVGCRVVGIDLSRQNVEDASAKAVAKGMTESVLFCVGDAEKLPFAVAEFDAVLCECAFCTFPEKQTAAAEFHRVLRPGGRVGISDLTRIAEPLPQLYGLLAWIACIGDAQPLVDYAGWLRKAGFNVLLAEPRNHHLREMMRSIRGRLLVADVLRGLGKLPVPGLDIAEANQFARAASDAIDKEQLGYGILIAARP